MPAMEAGWDAELEALRPLQTVGRRFAASLARFAAMFRTATHDNFVYATRYLRGLLSATKRNLERMEQRLRQDGEPALVADEYQALQHFLSEAPWAWEPLVAAVGDRVDERLGGRPDTALLLDETSFVKQGQHSVGVARQYCGRTGQVENCQVAVLAVLSAGDRAAPVGLRLFLPECWTQDAARCAAAGVPAAARAPRSKLDLALELVTEQVAAGRRFAFVGADAFYGHSAAFRRGLAAAGVQYVVDVPCTQTIYLADPAPAVPARRGPGRAPQQPQATTPGQSCAAYVAGLPPAAWQQLTLRETTRGPLVVACHCRRAWTYTAGAAAGEPGWVLVRREADGALRYAWSNAPADTPALLLAQRQAQRYWIERCFEDAKSEVGLAEYHVRGWLAWHHHLALVFVAMLFLLETRLFFHDRLPRLSLRDLHDWLSNSFRGRRRVPAPVLLAEIADRHYRRKQVEEAKRRRVLLHLNSTAPPI